MQPPIAKLPSVGSSSPLGRDYTTRSSAHGSPYVPLSNPETYNMTLEEAEADVRWWRAYADTVGGDAIVVQRPNDGGEPRRNQL